MLSDCDRGRAETAGAGRQRSSCERPDSEVCRATDRTQYTILGYSSSHRVRTTELELPVGPCTHPGHNSSHGVRAPGLELPEGALHDSGAQQFICRLGSEADRLICVFKFRVRAAHGSVWIPDGLSFEWGATSPLAWCREGAGRGASVGEGGVRIPQQRPQVPPVRPRARTADPRRCSELDFPLRRMIQITNARSSYMFADWSFCSEFYPPTRGFFRG